MGGAINGGTAQLDQQLVFRPVPGLGRAETPVAVVLKQISDRPPKPSKLKLDDSTIGGVTAPKALSRR